MTDESTSHRILLREVLCLIYIDGTKLRAFARGILRGRFNNLAWAIAARTP